MSAKQRAVETLKLDHYANRAGKFSSGPKTML
jgi:hypothetical protein